LVDPADLEDGKIDEDAGDRLLDLDCDPVARLDTKRIERIGVAGNRLTQGPIGQTLAAIGAAEGGLAGGGQEVAVEPAVKVVVSQREYSRNRRLS